MRIWTQKILVQSERWIHLISCLIDHSAFSYPYFIQLTEENGTDGSGPSLKKSKHDGSIEAPNDNVDEVPSSVCVNPGQEEINPLDYEESPSPTTEPTINDIYAARF